MHEPLIQPEFRTWNMSDGYPVRGRFWPARRAPASMGVLYLHGIQSHGGWYEWSASILADEAGCPVLMPDRRGSGLNTERRGDIASAEQWLRDVDEHVHLLRAECEVERILLVGVSWGGKLAAAWCQARCTENGPRTRPSVDAIRVPPPYGLMLIAPGVFPAVDLHWMEKVNVGVALLRSPEQLFPVPLNDAALFTDDPAGQRYIEQDPLKLTHVSARFLIESRRLDRKLHKLTDGALAIPVSVALAGNERIIRNPQTVAWARRVFDPPAEIREFAPAFHTLEYGRAQCEYGIWLRSRVREFARQCPGVW